MSNLEPINHRGHSSRINLEGQLVYTGSGSDGGALSYTQLYRNGIIEAVDSSILISDECAIPWVFMEKNIIEALSKYLRQLNQIEIKPPALIMLSLLNVKGWNIPPGSRGFFNSGSDKIDRDNLIIPDIFIEDFSVEADIIMKPIFDAMWNAAGHEKAIGYNDNGRWVGRR